MCQARRLLLPASVCLVRWTTPRSGLSLLECHDEATITGLNGGHQLPILVHKHKQTSLQWLNRWPNDPSSKQPRRPSSSPYLLAQHRFAPSSSLALRPDPRSRKKKERRNTTLVSDHTVKATSTLCLSRCPSVSVSVFVRVCLRPSSPSPYQHRPTWLPLASAVSQRSWPTCTKIETTRGSRRAQSTQPTSPISRVLSLALQTPRTLVAPTLSTYRYLICTLSNLP